MKSIITIAAACFGGLLGLLVIYLMLKFYFKLPLKLKMGVVGVEMDMCHLDKIKLEEEEELEQNMQKCRQIADALILRSPYIGLKFTRMIKDQPTGQAFLMEGIFNDSPVAVKLFLDDSKRNEIDILRALASTPPCEYLVRKLSHCNEPTPCIIFPLLQPLKWMGKGTLPSLVIEYANQVQSVF